MSTCIRAYFKNFVPGSITDATESEQQIKEYLAALINTNMTAYHYDENDNYRTKVTPDELILEVTEF